MTYTVRVAFIHAGASWSSGQIYSLPAGWKAGQSLRTSTNPGGPYDVLEVVEAAPKAGMDGQTIVRAVHLPIYVT